MSMRLIAVVEDDEDDFFFTQRELRRYTRDPILHLESGRAAIDYLGGEGAYGNRSEFPVPDLMFLDLKMDHVSGLDVLEWIRAETGRFELCHCRIAPGIPAAPGRTNRERS